MVDFPNDLLLQAAVHIADLPFHFPDEILLHVASFLDGPGIFNAILVCRHWYCVFEPRIWRTIKCNHWVHKSFPFHYFSLLQRQGKNKKQTISLRLVQHIEWNDYEMDDLGFEKNPPQFSYFLQMMPLLKTLSVVIFSPSTINIFTTQLANNKSITRLQLHLNRPRYENPMDIARFFDMFSRLHELKLGGNWYFYNEKSTVVSESNKKLPFKSNEKSERNKIWRIQYLLIPSDLYDFVANCPHLKELTVINGHRLPVDVVSRHIIDISLLNTSIEVLDLKFSNFTAQILHLNNMCSFNNLRSLSYFVNHIDDAKFLAPGAEGRLFIPCLDSLTIYNTNVSIWKFHHKEFTSIMSAFLSSRTLLKSFYVYGFQFHIYDIFGECKWVCTGLENLDISLITMTKTTEQARGLFKQIAKCTKLRKLMIYAEELSIDPSYGLMELSEQGWPIIPKLIALETLILCPWSKFTWCKDNLLLLLKVLPNLKNLWIKHPYVQERNCSCLRQYLHEIDRSDINVYDESRVFGSNLGFIYPYSTML